MKRSSSLAMPWYSIKPRKIKYVKGYGFLPFARKYKKQLLNTWLDVLKIASKEVVHETGEFIENKIADAVTNSNDNKIVKQEPVEDTIIPLEKRDEILKDYYKNETL